MLDKTHFTLEGLREIISIRASINWGLSENLQKIFPNIAPVTRPLIEESSIPDPNWLSGFVSGDGCF